MIKSVAERGKSKNEQDQFDGLTIREHLVPGDLGYLAYLHAKMYHAECGYDLEFEGYVCKTFYEFTQRYSPEGDRFFIAEKDGMIIGNIAILGHSEKEAQLRWFLILPEYRGVGLGREIFERAIEYCRLKGYKKVWLLTTDDQEKATAMYVRQGFKRISEEPISMWGRQLVERKFELPIDL
jgi:N-acetylglutamate synthase-like GNAT family acetyltransferase